MMRSALIPLAWLLLVTSVAAAQGDGGPAKATLPEVPTISKRYFAGGSAQVTVTGSLRFDTEMAIDTVASFGSGDKAWIQFGTSGSSKPNALLVFGDGDLGISVAEGKKSATAEAALCSGEAEVTADLVSGRYRCPEIDSYDPTTGKMGKVDITIRFTATTK
ncbi:MAG: hypothetical protein AB7R55_01625 [Gemmatimonadales bacterium]